MWVRALCCAVAVAATTGTAKEEELTCLSDEEGLAAAFEDPSQAVDLLQRSGLVLRGGARGGSARERLAAAAASWSSRASDALAGEEDRWREAVRRGEVGPVAAPRASTRPLAALQAGAAAEKPWEITCNEWSTGISKRGATWDCPRGQACACSRFNPRDGRWHCSEEEAKSPCVDGVPAAPTAYPRKVFFAAFKADMANAASGGVNIWNSTGWWVLDSVNGRQRMDTSTHVRALSSDSRLLTFSHSSRVLKSNGHFDTYDASIEDAFTSSKATVRCKAGTATELLSSPLAGSASRFLPVDATDVWKSHPDRFLRYEQVAGLNCSVWGWTELQADLEVGRHTVWIDTISGLPVREEQWHGLGVQGTYARVTFSDFEDEYGSFDALEARDKEAIFGLPASCTRTDRRPPGSGKR